MSDRLTTRVVYTHRQTVGSLCQLLLAVINGSRLLGALTRRRVSHCSAASRSSSHRFIHCLRLRRPSFPCGGTDGLSTDSANPSGPVWKSPETPVTASSPSSFPIPFFDRERFSSGATNLRISRNHSNASLEFFFSTLFYSGLSPTEISTSGLLSRKAGRAKGKFYQSGSVHSQSVQNIAATIA